MLIAKGLQPDFPLMTQLHPSPHAPWMAVAAAELGVCQWPDTGSNPRIVEYHRGTNIQGYDDKASWCSSFVNWCLQSCGVQGTGNALARSWLDWGQPLSEPVPGCVAVLWREQPDSWRGHVGFFLRQEGSQVLLLGGNQLSAVREHGYALDQVLAYRWPCAAGVATAQGYAGAVAAVQPSGEA